MNMPTRERDDERDLPRDLLDPAVRSAAVAALVAGDLDGAERSAVEAALASDAGLQREAAWWTSMRGHLGQQGRPAAQVPGPGLAAAIRQRMSRESGREAGRESAHSDAATAPAGMPGAAAGSERVLRFPAWLGFVAATAAACLVLYLGMTQQTAASTPQRELAYFEDGSAVVLPKDHQQGYMPITATNRVDLAAPAGQQAPAVRRPWLGLWTKPTALVGGSTANGLLVVRVVDGSPAALAGLRPGDVLLSMCDCNMSTRWCIQHALAEHQPGQPIEMTYHRPGVGARRVEVVLGASTE